MKKFAYAIVLLASFGALATSAMSDPCWDGIKRKCSSQPQSYAEYAAQEWLDFLN